VPLSIQIPTKVRHPLFLKIILNLKEPLDYISLRVSWSLNPVLVLISQLIKYKLYTKLLLRYNVLMYWSILRMDQFFTSHTIYVLYYVLVARTCRLKLFFFLFADSMIGYLAYYSPMNTCHTFEAKLINYNKYIS
jgi:hypothetical protein